VVALSSLAQSEWLCCEEERIPFSGNLLGGIASEAVARCVAARCTRSDVCFSFFIFSSGRLTGRGEERDCVVVCRLMEIRAEGSICRLGIISDAVVASLSTKGRQDAELNRKLTCLQVDI
jgi:hypothetical protein